MKILVSLFLLLLSCVSVQAVTMESLSNILVKTQIASTILLQGGFDIDCVIIDSLIYAGTYSETRTLCAGKIYKIFGIGSDGITDLDITLFDENGIKVAFDNNVDSVPEVIIIPFKTQIYKIKVLAYAVNIWTDEKNLFSLIISEKEL